MSITRWDPFRDMLSLRDAMNQLMEESFVRPGTARGGAPGAGAQGLALDIADHDQAYQVTASLPGARPEDIQVHVLGDTLTIRAETRTEGERQQGGYLLRERHSGVMQRAITLPGPIDPDAVEATYEHGILTLRLPKSQANHPRQIQIRASEGQTQLAAKGQQQGVDEPISQGQQQATGASTGQEQQQAASAATDQTPPPIVEQHGEAAHQG
jgi:HSP20 family protein